MNTVLCYHAVSDAWDDPLATPPAAFERQLRRLLRRGHRPATLDEVIERDSPTPLLHVTFDDAFRSVIAALPILGNLGIPATIFVCAAFATDGRALDIAELANETRRHPKEMETLTWDELRQFDRDGVRIESHTLTHAHLTRLADEMLDHELRASRADVERELGRPCVFLAYPYGEYDARVERAAKRAGYRAAFALPGLLDGRDPFALPRIGIWRRDGRVRFALKTSPAVRRLAARHPGVVARFRSPKPRPGGAAPETR